LDFFHHLILGKLLQWISKHEKLLLTSTQCNPIQMIQQKRIFFKWLSTLVCIEGAGAEVAFAWLELSSIYKGGLQCFLASHNHSDLAIGLGFELGMILLDANATQDNLSSTCVVFSSKPDDFGTKSTEIVIHLAAQLGIFIQIRQMWRSLIFQLFVLLFF